MTVPPTIPDVPSRYRQFRHRDVEMALSLVAANFGPRIILNFARRRTTKQAIGSFVAVFVFSLITLTTVYSGDNTFVPVVST